MKYLMKMHSGLYQVSHISVKDIKFKVKARFACCTESNRLFLHR